MPVLAALEEPPELAQETVFFVWQGAVILPLALFVQYIPSRTARNWKSEAEVCETRTHRGSKRRLRPRLSTGILTCLLLVSSSTAAASPREGQAVSGFAEVNGTRLYYEDSGTGRPVVFIGVGAGMDHRLWDDQFSVFARRFRVMRYDIRGWGKSAWPTESFSPLEDLAALLDFLKIERTCVVGLSFGGALAIDFAIAHPERVACLVLVAPGLSGWQFSEGFQRRYGPVIAALQAGDTERYVQLLLDDPILLPAKKNPAVREKAKRIWAENSKLPNVVPLGLDPPARNRLSEIHVPTLIVLGDHDAPDLYEIAQLLETEIAGARRVTIPDAGHTVNWETPKEFNRTVLEFLSGLETSSPK